MPTPYRILSDDTLNLLAERGNAQALMELGYRAERLAVLAEVQELANRLRESKLDQCLHVVREYVNSELADDPSQDDPSCELHPLIELVRNTTEGSTQAPPTQSKPPRTTNR